MFLNDNAYDVVQGMHITIQALEYSVTNRSNRNEKLKILSNVTAKFSPGRLTALMGPSGSGKTTLMDVLAGRKNTGVVQGTVLFDGQPSAPVVYQKFTSYVEQFDTLVPDLTVKQFLMYTASLKLPSSTNPEEIEIIVDRVISKLALEVCKDTVIGSELSRGISGGQAKRVNIAMALLTSPRILFLDEPTTGLDSHMANEVVLLLKSLASEGHTVLATIHSPTAFAFQQFDELCLLSSGNTIYSGDLGVNGTEMVNYFSNLGFKPHPSDSVVEWMIELISGRKLEKLSPSTKMEKRASIGHADNGDPEGGKVSKYDFVTAYAESKLAKTNSLEVKNLVEKLKSAKSTFDRNERVVNNSMLHGMMVIFKYRTLTHYSSGEFIGPRLGDKVIFSLLILSLYYGLGDSTNVQDVQSTAAMLYFVVAILGYGAASFTPSLTLDRPLFYRERSDGLYTTTTYYLAKFVEEAIIATLTSFVFTVTIFFGLNLQGNFGIFIFVYYLTAMVGIVLAYFVAAAVPTLEAANAALPTYVTICMFFGGLVIVYERIPPGWAWFSWLCFLRYPWTALMLNQFDNNKFNEEKLFAGETVLDFYGMTTGFTADLWMNVFVLVMFLIFFALCGLLALMYIRHDSR